MARAGLGTEAVVEAAAAIADGEGLDAVTLARLAGELGVRTPSLYAHVAGLGDLRRRLGIRGSRELAAELQAAAAGRAGRDALQAIAAAYRAHARAHPGTYLASQRAPGPDDEEALAAADAVVRIVLAVLAGYGLQDDDAVHAARSVRAALHGFALLESGEGFRMRLSVDESFERMVALLHAGLSAG